MLPTRKKNLVFESLFGQILTKIVVHAIDSEEAADDLIEFATRDGKRYMMYHGQSCCEHVAIESIVGDLHDLIGTPITLAEHATDSDEATRQTAGHTRFERSHTWTFYKLATIRGYVDIRWYGKSSGHYSEEVSFAMLDPAWPSRSGGRVIE